MTTMTAEPIADTPALRQWKQFKQSHPGYLLLFRMGDFYEAFHDDAKTLHEVCGTALTKRSNGGGDSGVPMAGLPFHSVENYLAQLVGAGHKVAICEPKAGGAGNGEREITRTATIDNTGLKPTVAPPATPALRVIANRAGLVAALSAAVTVVPSRTPKPVLQCFRLSAGDDTLAVEATNLEQWVRHTQSTVQVEQAGALCVPADALLKACRELSGDTLKLETDERGESLIVRSEYATVRMAALSAGDFPHMGETPAPLGEIPAAAFLRMLLLARMTAADEATRYAFNSVAIDAPEGKKAIFAVAADSRRMTITECPWRGPALPQCLIPLPAVDALLKGLDDEADVGIALGEREAAFICGQFTLRTNLIEGAFPAYGDWVPRDADKRLTADRESLLATLRQAGLGAGEPSKEHSPELRLDFSRAGLKATGRHENREAVAKLPCKWDGADLTIGFNLECLLDGLNALASAEVVLNLSAPHRPLLITEPGFKYVLAARQVID